MNNAELLKQARKSVIALIKESPIKITVKRFPLVDDGSGDGTLVPDPYGTPDDYTMTVRISHERRQPANLGSAPAGLSTNLSRFVMVDYKTTIYQGDTFEALGKYWEIGPVDPLMKFGGATGYQAPLREAEGMEEDVDT